MPTETENFKAALLDAYALIRQQQEQICDLLALTAPLIDSLPAVTELGTAYRASLAARQTLSYRSKLASLAYIDEKIDQVKRL